MIAKAEMMLLLGQACPSFRSRLARSATSWQDEDESMVHAVLDELGRHVIALVGRDETASLPATFAVIERLHLEGDPWVRESAAFHLLEVLHTNRFHHTTKPEQLRPHLGPESESAWDALDAFPDDDHE